MRPLILLDIDGVLNPVVRPGRHGSDGPSLVLSDARIALVRELARCGQIAWVSTWPAEQTSGLEAQLLLGTEPPRIPLPARALEESGAATPKLRPVIRWLARMEASGEADWDAVVWIDDVLGPDVYSWAAKHSLPVLLVKPAAATGLTAVHAESVERFCNS